MTPPTNTPLASDHSATRSPAATARPGERDYAALAARVMAAATPPLRCQVYGQQVTRDGAERYDLLMVRIPALSAGGRGRYRVLLNGGTHGDEPAGAEAVTRFLEERRYERWPEVAFTVLPCANPWGYAHDTREGPSGRDLNRSFRRATPATREISALKQALARQAFDLLIDCHEDVDAPGLYVFAPRRLGAAIVEAAKRIGPVHPGPDVDGQIPLKDSVVVLDDGPEAAQRRRTWNQWPLPFYVARFHGRERPSDSATAAGGNSEAENVRPPAVPLITGATVETPTSLPMAQRVAMHHAAIDAALATLSS
jgi:hypothetical protein